MKNNRDRFGYRWVPPPTTQRDLMNLSMERSMVVGEGVYRICTQLLGLSSANVVLQASNRCPKKADTNVNDGAATFFARHNWHRRPSREDIMGWNGSSATTKK